jgi:hypothetical protein
MSKLSNDHLVIITEIEEFKKAHPDLTVNPLARQGCFYCMGCGEHFNYDTPIGIKMIIGIHNAFIKSHRRCKPKPKSLL